MGVTMNSFGVPFNKFSLGIRVRKGLLVVLYKLSFGL
jgi:hypothetical protein